MIIARSPAMDVAEAGQLKMEKHVTVIKPASILVVFKILLILFTKKLNKMKKQIKKLSLNKKTISNLQPSEMNKMIGGARSYLHVCNGPTQKGKTCYGHKTC